ncbi:hypothetical protein BDN70DRAFT_884577 [Pholiota conissans]|uniref:Uncharacterized protein n=1 Tax=Pholiota conissans TaxID=109636 RepID=A0A9P5YRQ3_9AGAR|nr:hypothetical protein BDN70DRAFT_884577 [Pholiota conissans]
MEFALAAANHLQPVADALVYINTSKVHPFWFPFPWAPTLHAARVSMIFHTNARRSPAQLSWGTHIIGYLIMCWGGSLLSHFLLGLPPPMLYSFDPSITYISVHLFITSIFYLFPDLLYAPVMDTILWPLDALLRTNAVTATLGLLYLPGVHAEYQNSPLTHMIIGAIASAGGGLSAATLGSWTPNWSLSTPPVLRPGAGWSGTLDVWGGALVALIYSSTTGHPAFSSLRRYVTLILSSPYLSMAWKPHADSDFPPLSTLQAKSLATAVLGIFFAARVVNTHWLIPVNVVVPSTSGSGVKKSSKKKAEKMQ